MKTKPIFFIGCLVITGFVYQNCSPNLNSNTPQVQSSESTFNSATQGTNQNLTGSFLYDSVRCYKSTTNEYVWMSKVEGVVARELLTIQDHSFQLVISLTDGQTFTSSGDFEQRADATLFFSNFSRPPADSTLGRIYYRWGVLLSPNYYYSDSFNHLLGNLVDRSFLDIKVDSNGDFFVPVPGTNTLSYLVTPVPTTITYPVSCYLHYQKMK